MFKPFQVSLFIMALLALMAFAMPGRAYAQAAATTATPCAAGGDWQNNYANNLKAAAQDRSTASANVFTGVPDIDVKLNYCMDMIKAMFDINIALSNPLGLIANIIRDQILALVNQACSAALSAVNQVIQFGLSQFNRLCVPLPSFSLGSFNLGLKNVPCNGVNLLGVKTTQGPVPPPPTGYNIWARIPVNKINFLDHDLLDKE